MRLGPFIVITAEIPGHARLYLSKISTGVRVLSRLIDTNTMSDRNYYPKIERLMGVES